MECDWVNLKTSLPRVHCDDDVNGDLRVKILQCIYKGGDKLVMGGCSVTGHCLKTREDMKMNKQ